MSRQNERSDEDNQIRKDMLQKLGGAFLAVLAVVVVFYLILRDPYPITPFNPPPAVAAGGKVLVGGRPKGGVRVSYHPQFDIGAVKFAPTGMTNNQGVFALSTASPGDGAPPGEYVVTFELPVTKAGAADEDVDVFKGKYADPATSKWKVKVAEGSQETFNLD